MKSLEMRQEWEKWWWKNVNEKCLECKHECKQSSHVEILDCPQFETRGKYNGVINREEAE